MPMTDNMMSTTSRLQLFAMKTLLLETDLQNLEDKGVEIGHTKTIQTSEVVDKNYSKLTLEEEPKKWRISTSCTTALKNTIRVLISERMKEKHGPGWWDQKVPAIVKKEVKGRQEEERDTPMSIRSEDPLTYATFG